MQFLKTPPSNLKQTKVVFLTIFHDNFQDKISSLRVNSFQFLAQVFLIVFKIQRKIYSIGNNEWVSH